MLSDRQINRASEKRVVTITDVDVANKKIIARDEFGSTLAIAMHLGGDIMAVPASGERWVVQRQGNQFYLDMRIVDVVADLQAGDKRIEASGSLYLSVVAVISTGSGTALPAFFASDIAPGQGAFGAKRTSDSVTRLSIFDDGKIEWGPGGASVRDTALFRAGTDHLKTNSLFTSRFDGVYLVGSQTVGATGWTTITNLIASGVEYMDTTGTYYTAGLPGRVVLPRAGKYRFDLQTGYSVLGSNYAVGHRFTQNGAAFPRAQAYGHIQAAGLNGQTISSVLTYDFAANTQIGIEAYSSDGSTHTVSYELTVTYLGV